MGRISGYVLNIGLDRRDELLAAIEEGELVAEAVSDFEHSRNVPLVCFLSFEKGVITHLSHGKRGQKAATGLRRLNLSSILTLEDAIDIWDIIGMCPPRLAGHADIRFNDGGLLPPATFQSVVDAVSNLSHEARRYLAPFSAEREAKLNAISIPARDSLAAQKESVATALAIADIDRTKLEGWDPYHAHRSFLDGLPAARSREDAIVVADLGLVPGFERIYQHPFAAAVFENEQVRLTLALANRLPLEQQTGADLIYFNETYRSFVFVQYKMMEGAEGGGAIFRLPNEQLTEEIRRMDLLLRSISDVEGGSEAPNNFRILQDPFFLKFCPRTVFNPDDISLSKGMYLPLELWKILDRENHKAGPRGGRYIDFRNVGRYLDNTQFIGLVANAWVGTSVNQSARLEEIIRLVLETGRSLTLAVKTDKLAVL